MPDYSRIEVINTIFERGLIARIGVGSFETLRPTVTAVVDGGARVVEIVLKRQKDTENIGRLAAHLRDSDPVVILGAGPAGTPSKAAHLIDLGVDFITDAAFDPETARLCNGRKQLYIPVCESLEKIAAAEEAGVEIIGFDNADPGDMGAVLEKRPRSVLMPATCVETEAVPVWIEAGAACVSLEFGQTGPDPTATAADVLWAIHQARGNPLFSGVEHVGLYPSEPHPAQELADWYARVFGFDLIEGDTYYFASSSGPGRIEILKTPEPVKAHVAVKVKHFEAGCQALLSQGFELEPVKDFGRTKAIFCKQRDPAGNKVHLLYLAIA
jgi:2-dehydro-3-deoxyphosphogluconate aldolase/(4S)-4-hydroxy-2-oxoglutarate aldolase